MIHTFWPLYCLFLRFTASDYPFGIFKLFFAQEYKVFVKLMILTTTILPAIVSIKLNLELLTPPPFFPLSLTLYKEKRGASKDI